ncbi:MAG TPA: pirin family protein, partial [Puia sp.]|nr:pirin family protein [Puia sp.]
MQSIFYPASERGHANFGWLDSHHSFSFGQWYDPKKIHFGALRVLNDDIVQGAGGFGMHPHDNMEIVSIPLKGALKHKDSTGTDGVIATGDVQIMSAGTGIRHSEFNASNTDAVNFLQVWVIPKERNIKPRYDQKAFDNKDRVNQWQVVVSPDRNDNGLWINQDARFALTKLEEGKSISYEPKFKGNGVYLFVIEGVITIDGKKVAKRDAIGLFDTTGFTIQADKDAEILAIEVPM